MSWFNPNFNDFAFSFLSVLFEGIPFLLLGALVSGLVDVFVPAERMQRLLPANPVAGILISGLLGLVFPICECGSVVVIRRFIRKGLPVASAVAIAERLTTAGKQSSAAWLGEGAQNILPIEGGIPR